MDEIPKRKKKMPYMQFYPMDWIYDTRILTLEERGVWIDLLCFMWNAPTRGILEGDGQNLAKLVGLEWGHFKVVINSLSANNVLTVTDRNGKVTLISRRMVCEENERESSRRRAREFRERQSNAKVTPKKSEVRSQKAYKDLPPNPLSGGFQMFWSSYPRRLGKGAAEKAWARLKPDELLVNQILNSIQLQKKSDQWQKEGGTFIPYPATWLNQRRWEDEVSIGQRSSPFWDKIMGKTDGAVRKEPQMGGLPEL